jgi:hypothetical protein
LELHLPVGVSFQQRQSLSWDLIIGVFLIASAICSWNKLSISCTFQKIDIPIFCPGSHKSLTWLG